eukprot:gnl/TRDRNA2_/TRDRNA2_117941_c1_seq1.p1 gnl/TRDRNA2_/TRDRNA2_117941_c1~~gnl/TRDRNA2_/TRDRNA2_117941_c1_seq1.p1  ORF type:complete len:167 (+),score=19.54 gnl/TRDRNA2_/TRDRNA2_117941_c1_seq1:2-502(+)
MVMCMLGSQIFSTASDKISIESIGGLTFVISAICHVVIVLTPDTVIRFASFLLFEMCVGIYFPMMGTLKGSIVPEESRSAIYNLFRVPLNAIVTSVLVMNIGLSTAFLSTTAMLCAATICQWKLRQLRTSPAASLPASPSHHLSVEKYPMVIGKTNQDEELSDVHG